MGLCFLQHLSVLLPCRVSRRAYFRTESLAELPRFSGDLLPRRVSRRGLCVTCRFCSISAAPAPIALLKITNHEIKATSIGKCWMAECGTH